MTRLDSFLRLWTGVIALSLASLLLAACEVDPEDYDPCPPIVAPEDATRTRVVGDRIGQVVDIRFFGVYGQCIQRGDQSDMNLVVNLYMSRDIKENPSAEGVVVYVTIAVLDASDQVVSRKVVDRYFFIPALSLRSTPVFATRINVPDGGRVLVGLGRVADAEDPIVQDIRQQNLNQDDEVNPNDQ